jgi:class 3 adenylate cyclase
VKTQLDLHRINQVTGKFVPGQFLRALGRERITEVRLGDHIQKEVTVFFSDIRDYTILAEEMTPEENFAFVSSYYRRIGPIIEQNGGFVNQYLGDGIMAIFPGRPADALKAALGIQEKLEEYNQERAGKGRSLIRIGTGMHTGPLIMGVIGDRKRMDAATIADTVNTASRIEGLTKYYGANILLSDHTFKGIDPTHVTDESQLAYIRPLGRVKLKGKKRPITIYEYFAGDRRKVRDGKRKTLIRFNEGMQWYHRSEFTQAAGIFKEVLAANPDDQTVRMLLERAEKYNREGVPANWSGVEIMDFK